MENIEMQALAILGASAKPSICTLQRRMNIGYGQARRIMDALVEAGAVTVTLDGLVHVYTVNR